MEIFTIVLAVGFVFFAIGVSVTLGDFSTKITKIDSRLEDIDGTVENLNFSNSFNRAGIEVLYRAVGKTKVNSTVKTMKKEVQKELKKVKSNAGTHPEAVKA